MHEKPSSQEYPSNTKRFAEFYMAGIRSLISKLFTHPAEKPAASNVIEVDFEQRRRKAS